MMSARKSLLIVFGVAAVATVLLSCGGNEQPAEPMKSATPLGRPIDPATAGSVTGMIKLDGMPPRMRPINMAADPVCAGMHPQPATTENVITDDSGALQNVFVYLQGDFSAYAIPKVTTPAELDQRGCMFEPHVLGMQTSQSLTVKNTDQTTHNVHPVPKNNREWNETQPPGAAPLSRDFPREEVAIPVKCNIHPWMQSYVAVLSSPYFQVTGPDGEFSLTNVPPGSYTLFAWHELYGTSQQAVTIGPGESRTVNLTFKAQAAAEVNRNSILLSELLRR
jgi:hypothetical protein